ncbi:hydrolase [Leucothrix sargassi]|nr:hydrolase [Leucothrix sargassi]
MYRVMCFGDSNTWGYKPENGERYDRSTRWPCVMHEALGEGFELVEEGLNGRTTVWDDPVDGLMSGLNYLEPCLKSHKPLDVVLLMLGTNDLKDRYCVTAPEIAKSVGRLVKHIQKCEYGPNNSAPEVVLMAPPPTILGLDGVGIRVNGSAKSQDFGVQYAAVAKELKCDFVDVGKLIESSPIDGVHWSAESHVLLGLEMAKVVSFMASDDV